MIVRETSRFQEVPSVLELILPGYSYEVVENLVRFIYTDSFGKLDLSTDTKVLDLWKGSKELNLIGLENKCQEILLKDYGFDVEDSAVFSESTKKMIDDYHMKGISLVPTFASDMSRALQSGQFSDVKITVKDNERALYGHQCILRCASGFFRDVLDSRKQDINGVDRPQASRAFVIVELPGTFEEIERLIFNLYTNFLVSDVATNNPSRNIDVSSPSSPPVFHFGKNYDNLVQDLINAHRYRLVEMKSQVESAISMLITPDNVCDVLLLSSRVNSSRLRIECIHALTFHMKEQLSHGPSITNRLNHLLSSHSSPSDIIDSVFELIKISRGITLTTCQERRDAATIMARKSRMEKVQIEETMMKELIGTDLDGRMVKDFFLSFVIIFCYMYLQKSFDALKAFVPVMNGLSLIFTFRHLFAKIK